MIRLENSSYRYTGRLEETPLPIMLRKIEMYKVPGVVQLQNGFMIKKLFLKNGKIIFATSNQKQDRLGEFLMKQGVIDQAIFDEATRQLKKSRKKRFGRILVEMGVLTPHQLFLSVLDQIHHIVMSVFEWTEGDVTFVIGEYKDDELIKLNLPIPKAILEGVHFIQNDTYLLQHIGGLSARFEVNPRVRFEIHELGLTESDRKILAYLENHLSVREILHRNEHQPLYVLQLIYGLHVLERITPLTNS